LEAARKKQQQPQPPPTAMSSSGDKEISRVLGSFRKSSPKMIKSTASRTLSLSLAIRRLPLAGRPLLFAYSCTLPALERGVFRQTLTVIRMSPWSGSRMTRGNTICRAGPICWARKLLGQTGSELLTESFGSACRGAGIVNCRGRDDHGASAASFVSKQVSDFFASLLALDVSDSRPSYQRIGPARTCHQFAIKTRLFWSVF
jgi:hypothetical protein